MNAVLTAIRQRRSIRKFKPDAVPRETLDQIIEAGLYAASGKGLQTARIIAVTNPEELKKLSAVNCRIGGWKEGFDPFYGAPAALIVIADKSSPNCVCDGSLAMGNLMLAAHSLGLGSCWINRAREAFEMDYGKELLKRLGIEGDWVGIGNCAVGYIEGDVPEAAARKADRVYYIE